MADQRSTNQKGFLNFPLFVYFHSFSQCKDKQSTNVAINDESVDGVPGTRTQAAGWKGQINPLSYGGTQTNQKVTTHFYAHYLDDAWYGIRDS